jgi:hypothetical protein
MPPKMRLGARSPYRILAKSSCPVLNHDGVAEGTIGSGISGLLLTLVALVAFPSPLALSAVLGLCLLEAIPGAL